MTTFYPGGGSTVNNLGMNIVGVGSTSRTDVSNVQSGHSDLKSDGNNAAISDSATTILRGSTSNVLSYTSVSGYTAILLGTTPTIGSTVSVQGASYPFNGSYYVMDTSGNYAITSTRYSNCSGIGTSGVYSLNTGSFDSPTQGQFLIMGNTTEIAGQTNIALQRNISNDSDSLHPMRGYRSPVYTNYWSNYYASGTIAPCNVTSTDVTFAQDQAASGVPTVLMSIGLKVQAADLENPDTTGLRDPA